MREKNTHLENGEDKLFAPNEDNRGCPLTKKRREAASDAVSRFLRLFFVYIIVLPSIKHHCRLKFYL